MATTEAGHGSGPRAGPKAAALLLLAVGTLAAFGRVCGNDFVNYDDRDYVTDNPHVQSGLTPASVAWAFTTTHAANWHPLTWLSLELDHQLFGMAPWGYHLTSLLLHTANALLLFLALERMTGAVWRSAMVAALFAVHPLHVESVAWVSERKDVLSTLFWMLTLLAYARYAERPGPARYLVVMLLVALGLMAKPMLVTLPCVLLLLDYWPLRRLRVAPPGESPPGRSGRPPLSVARAVAEKVPLLALSAASSVVTLVAQRPAMMSVTALPVTSRFLNALAAYAGYVGKAAWPRGLAVLYPYPGAWFYVETVAVGALLVAVTGWALWQARRKPYLAVGWLWYVGTLVPVIGLVQVGSQRMADRYTYVPLVGLFIMVVWWVAGALEPWPRRRLVLVPLSAAVLAGCVVPSFIQAGYWHDTRRLWEHALAVTTDNAEAHLQVGWAKEQEGQVREAVRHYRQALEIAPDHPKAHQFLGGALVKQGQWEEARQEFAAALRTSPQDANVHRSLGLVLSTQGRLEEATEHFTLALAGTPDSADAHNNLGAVLLRRGEPAAALPHFAAALRIEPNNAAAHFNRGLALEQLGRNEEAVAEYRAALRIRPHSRAREHLEALEQAGKP
jgi:Tfp pilus assembly protein PilF